MMPSHTSQRMKGTNLTLKARSVSFWDMGKKRRVIDPHKWKVFYSRDVKFNESEKREGSTESYDSRATYQMELDFSDNSDAHLDASESPVQSPVDVGPRRSER